MDRMPEKPVKLMSRRPLPYRVMVSDPALTLTLMELASVPPAALATSIERVPVLPEYVAFTEGVPATVRPVDVSVVQIVAALPVSAMLPVPKSMDRVLELFDEKDKQVRMLPPRDSAPVVRVNRPVKVGEPVRESVMSDLFTVQVEVAAVAATVTMAAVPLLASNVTVSAVVGAEAPEAPPLVADQLVVELLSHVPEPPTQNLDAIAMPFDCSGDHRLMLHTPVALSALVVSAVRVTALPLVGIGAEAFGPCSSCGM